MIGEPVDGRADRSDPAAVACNVADQPVLTHGGGQRRAQVLPHPVDDGRGVAGGQLQVRERVELAHGQCSDPAVAELRDEMVLDDQPVVRQRCLSKRPTAGLALDRKSVV